MKHSIRQRVINQYGLPVVKIETVNGELGSGILDKNGKEIFENDTIILPKKRFHFQLGNVTFTAKGEEVVVPNFKSKAGLTRGMLAQIIQCSELKEAKS